ncbi:MAG TPA: SLC13 family permease [Chiayiivirga sp.]|nr:SLC13 family permease [Chiayiivirga sp.]HRO88565.1 SLC13 family permease [Chiayiivirga sp.]HRQ35097.1 SLC13 family permease [Chiayiivirga sp.]
MTLDIVLVLAVTIGAITLFATEKLRMDVVAIFLVATLTLLGLITPSQALSGFSNQATITVAAMFVLAAGLRSSGALSGVGRMLTRVKSPTAFLLLLFAALALVSPFVNNTAVVAVFMPIVLTASARVGLPASKALIPLSYMSQIAGVCTLVGTSSNLLVDAIARDLGHPGFTMFEFTALGAVCFAAGGIYLLTFGRWLLPDTRQPELDEEFEPGKYITELRVMPGSALLGTSVEEARLAARFDVFVLELLRDGKKLWSPRSQTLQTGDILLARGDWARLDALRKEAGLAIEAEHKFKDRQLRKDANLVISEVMIAPNSRLEGLDMEAVDRIWRHNVTVLAIQRRGQVLREKIKDVAFSVGDILLMIVPENEMHMLRRDKNVIVLSKRGAARPSGWRAPFALATMALVIIVSALGWMPIALTSLVGAAVMVTAGCLGGDDAYEAVDWRIIIVLACLLPLGVAMSQSGAAEFLVRHLIGLVEPYGPWVVLAMLYLAVLMLSEVMSHAAAAVLLTPIAMSTAHLMGVDATPFLIAVTFAAGTSFATPVGYQTNTMVYNAGGYRFVDFMKVGLPLNLIFWVIGIIMIPKLWPF